MSDDWLLYIPVDPEFVPPGDSAENARALLAQFLPQANKVTARRKNAVTFFHPGGNWSGVQCPECNTNIEQWWQEVMTTASESQFENLIVRTPCCGVKRSLNDLHYVWPAAFGRFVLEAMNPNDRDLGPEKEAELARALGCGIRKVWIHL
jgi:hypothetical protein